MKRKSGNDAAEQFSALLNAMDAAVDAANRSGTRAFEDREYEAAKRAADHASKLESIRKALDDLRMQWLGLTDGESREVSAKTESASSQRKPKPIKRPSIKPPSRQSSNDRLPNHVRTPQSSYSRAILQALVEMGGRAEAARVLDRVEEILKPTLKGVDYESLPNSPSHIRWRNAAQWARNKMVIDRLLKSDSPRGVWEITKRGRELLKQDDS